MLGILSLALLFGPVMTVLTVPRHVYAIRADGSSDTPVVTRCDIYTHPNLQLGR